MSVPSPLSAAPVRPSGPPSRAAGPPAVPGSGLSGWKRLRERLAPHFDRDDALGYLVSLCLHVVLLALLAIPVLRTMQQEEGFTTLVQSGEEEHRIVFDDPIDTELSLPALQTSGAESLQLAILDARLDPDDMVRQLDPAAATALDGEDGSDGQDDGPAISLRVAEPKNSIRAGSFSVWPWPIKSQLANFAGGELKNVVHEEPGTYPKLDQNYHIVIRLKVPDGRKTVSPSDFSGEVIGTDGYRQRIPDRAEFYNSRGVLTQARSGRRIPVIDGTAELLIHVPAAGLPNIRDTITVHSRMLDERQKIELVFQAR